MRLAVVAAGFTPARPISCAAPWGPGAGRASSTNFVASSSKGCVPGLSEEFAISLFEQIRGFGEYGFPESHAASFALLVYASPG